jgi:hypothetical protein
MTAVVLTLNARFFVFAFSQKLHLSPPPCYDPDGQTQNVYPPLLLDVWLPTSTLLFFILFNLTRRERSFVFCRLQSLPLQFGSRRLRDGQTQRVIRSNPFSRRTRQCAKHYKPRARRTKIMYTLSECSKTATPLAYRETLSRRVGWV